MQLRLLTITILLQYNSSMHIGSFFIQIYDMLQVEVVKKTTMKHWHNLIPYMKQQ